MNTATNTAARFVHPVRRIELAILSIYSGDAVRIAEAAEAAPMPATWADFDAAESRYRAARKAVSAALRARGPKWSDGATRALCEAVDSAYAAERLALDAVGRAWVAANNAHGRRPGDDRRDAERNAEYAAIRMRKAPR